MSHHKGYHLLKSAVSNGDFSHISLLIVDHSIEEGEKYCSRWGSSDVEFISKYRQSSIEELYARLDILVAPSIWPESFGLVTREALSCGIWVIASDRGAIGKDIIDDLNGMTISVEDERELQQALSIATFERIRNRSQMPYNYSSPKDYISLLDRIYKEI